jgi:hypothetical protein
MNPTSIGIIIITVMAVACVFAFIHAQNVKDRREHHAWSNKQVLWELRSIQLHRPHHIVQSDEMELRRIRRSER